MRRAMALARNAAEYGEVPVGAVLVRGGQILGEGFNSPISRNDPTAHAEIIALREAARREGNYRLPGSVLYVTVEPCMMCAGALVQARIERLVFGASEPRSGVVATHGCLLNSAHHNHRVSWTQGVLARECAVLLQQFFAARR